MLWGCPPSSLGDPAAPGEFAGDGDDDSVAGQSDASTGPGPSDPDHPDIGCDLQEVMARPENGCTNAGCHGAQFQGNLDLA